jgi:hypothetical protein
MSRASLGSEPNDEGMTKSQRRKGSRRSSPFSQFVIGHLLRHSTSLIHTAPCSTFA